MKKCTVLSSLLCFCWFYSFSVSAISPEFPHLEVTGKGEVSVEPDMAEFSVDVLISKKRAKQAKKAVDEMTTQFIDRLLQQGVKRDNIQSGNLRLIPEYSYSKGKQAELTGYKAMRNITVEVVKLDKLNSYLDSALDDGVNRINNIELKTSQQQEYLDIARKKAIEDASTKARSIAKDFNTTIKGVWKIIYGNNNNYRPIAMKVMNDSASVGISGAYQDTKIVISDTISAIYRLEE